MQGKWERRRQRRRCGLTPPVGGCVRATHSLWERESGASGRRTVLITPTSRVWGFRPRLPLPSTPLPGPGFPAQQIRGNLSAFGIISVITVLVMNHKGSGHFFSPSQSSFTLPLHQALHLGRFKCESSSYQVSKPAESPGFLRRRGPAWQRVWFSQLTGPRAFG